MDMQLFTWEALLTINGASLLTYFIVQYTKKLVDRLARDKKIPTDWYAVAVAWIVLLVANFATGAPVSDWRLYFLSFANAFIIAAYAALIQNKALRPPGDGDKK